LNYELDSYIEAVKRFPSPSKKLKLAKGVAFFQKMDIFKEMLGIRSIAIPTTGCR